GEERAGTRPDAVSPSAHSRPDGGLHGAGAADPAHRILAPAHGRSAATAATAAAAVAGRCPPLPAADQGATRRGAAGRWRAAHDELCLTIGTGEPLPPPVAAGAVAGVDLGEAPIAAVTRTRR